MVNGRTKYIAANHNLRFEHGSNGSMDRFERLSCGHFNYSSFKLQISEILRCRTEIIEAIGGRNLIKIALSDVSCCMMGFI